MFARELGLNIHGTRRQIGSSCAYSSDVTKDIDSSNINEIPFFTILLGQVGQDDEEDVVVLIKCQSVDVVRKHQVFIEQANSRL